MCGLNLDVTEEETGKEKKNPFCSILELLGFSYKLHAHQVERPKFSWLLDVYKKILSFTKKTVLSYNLCRLTSIIGIK